MELEGSLPCLQQSVTGPHPPPVEPVHDFTAYLFRVHFNIILPTLKVFKVVSSF